MRKLKLQAQMTIDGFIAGTNGEMDWMKFPWTTDTTDYVNGITEPVDTILLGRILAEGFIPHWTAALENPEVAVFAKKMVETPKVVFTKTLKKSIWDNTVLATGELADEINELKKQAGKDMIAYGGAKFVSSLIKERLIDELHLFVNPAVLGIGMPIFQTVSEKQNYELTHAQHFECGIAVLVYKQGK